MHALKKFFKTIIIIIGIAALFNIYLFYKHGFRNEKDVKKWQKIGSFSSVSKIDYDFYQGRSNDGKKETYIRVIAKTKNYQLGEGRADISFSNDIPEVSILIYLHDGPSIVRFVSKKFDFWVDAGTNYIINDEYKKEYEDKYQTPVDCFKFNNSSVSNADCAKMIEN
jgi:hypothetical protein